MSQENVEITERSDLMLDHVGFGVSDYKRSKAFYSEALAPLDIELIKEPSEQAAGFGRGGKPFFWIEATRPPITLLHVAFACDSRGLVDAFHQAGLAAGGTDNGAPGPRPIYHQHYYGAYVLDPDGNNIEAVCHRPA
jgi:catechol 2,3-dioxygenase-like lactoylglutathione lyase family enzyme